MSLSDTQKRHLKGLAHPLKPVVMVGQHGLRDTVLEEVELALVAHELIKVRVSAEDRDSRATMIEQIVAHSSAEIVQRIGHIVVLFRRNEKKPKVVIPNR